MFHYSCYAHLLIHSKHAFLFTSSPFSLQWISVLTRSSKQPTASGLRDDDGNGVVLFWAFHSDVLQYSCAIIIIHYNTLHQGATTKTRMSRTRWTRRGWQAAMASEWPSRATLTNVCACSRCGIMCVCGHTTAVITV